MENAKTYLTARIALFINNPLDGYRSLFKIRLEASLFVERIGGVVADVEMFYRYSSREILFFEETKATSLLRLFLTLSQFAFYLFIYPSLSFNPINRSICDRSLPLRKREE